VRHSGRDAEGVEGIGKWGGGVPLPSRLRGLVCAGTKRRGRMLDRKSPGDVSRSVCPVYCVMTV